MDSEEINLKEVLNNLFYLSGNIGYKLLNNAIYENELNKEIDEEMEK